MTKFVTVTLLDNYILHITTDDDHTFDFNVLEEMKRIPSYRRLYDLEFFKQAKFRNKRIYWDSNYDFHIDQGLARAKNAA